MTATLIVFLALAGAVIWLFAASRRGAHEPTAHRRWNGDADRDELEAAERDVQDAASADEVRDWGPGATKPRPPELL